MLNYITGKERLEKGLAAFFKKFEYQSVDQYDLWNTLEEVKFFMLSNDSYYEIPIQVF